MVSHEDIVGHGVCGPWWAMVSHVDSVGHGVTCRYCGSWCHMYILWVMVWAMVSHVDIVGHGVGHGVTYRYCGSWCGPWCHM